jgi:hypothetical protein
LLAKVGLRVDGVALVVERSIRIWGGMDEKALPLTVPGSRVATRLLLKYPLRPASADSGELQVTD